MERYQRALAGAFIASAVVTLSSRAHCDEASAFAKRAAHEAGVSVARAAEIERAIDVATAEHAELKPLVMAVAIRESNLLPSVESCDKVGDGGRAFGLFQEHARGEKRDFICNGGARAQAKVAVEHLLSCGTTDEARVACYAGRAITHRVVADRLSLAKKLADSK